LKVPIEYGDDKMVVDLPEDTILVGPRNSLSIAATNPVNEIRRALETPRGCERIRDIARRGNKIVIAFPDKVKGGPFHRRLAIPLILDELKQANVPAEDVMLLCINGLHRKNPKEEITDYLGQELVNQFWPNQLVCHDAEDEERMVHLGTSDSFGDPVDTNRLIVESDLVILLGHALPNHYGGFSGGYKGLVTGTGSWRSIAAHHSPTTIGNPDLLPVSPCSTMRKQFSAQGKTIVRAARGKIFCLDAVTSVKHEIVGEFAGSIEAVQEESWKLSKRVHTVEVPRKADVVVVGLPRTFHYGPGMGTNPILILNALGGLTARLYPCLNDEVVIIVASLCDGWFNDEYFPSYREVYKAYGECTTPSDLAYYQESVSTNSEYVASYRNRYAYHPFHAFSMMYYGEIALRHTSNIFVVGAKQPGIARSMGLTPTKNFERAWQQAKSKVGRSASVIALPGYFLQPPPLFELSN
jgi:nickel-dependent lactate racemase